MQAETRTTSNSDDIVVMEKFVEQQGKAAKAAGKEPTADDVFALQGVIMKMSRGGMFAAGLPNSCDKHYAGKGVKLNTPDTPVFWYRPEKSETYRVIYADLTVKSVSQAPTSTPTTGETQPANSQAQQTLDKAISMGADIPPDKRPLVLRILNLNEMDAVEGLRLFATWSGGRYPTSLDGKTLMKEAEGWAKRNKIAKPQKDESVPLILCIGFHDKLLRENKEPKYFGDRITRDDAKKVLLRWKRDRTTYRVIYGDLTMGEADAVRLAELEQSATP